MGRPRRAAGGTGQARRGPVWFRAAWVWAAGALSVEAALTRDQWPLVRMAFTGPWAPQGAFLQHWFSTGASVAWAALFWLAARAQGSALLRWIGAPRNLPRREAGPARLILGFGLYGCVVVALGLAGLFFAPVALAVLLPGAAAGGVQIWRGRTARPAGGRAPADVRWLAGMALAAAALFAVFSLTPETWIDSLAYHLTAPQDFNKLHKWWDTGQDMDRYPLLPEGIYGQGLLLMGEPLAIRLNLLGSVLTGWLLWAWARRVAGPAGAWLAVLALLASDQVGFHMGQANEGMYAVAFATLGVWAWTFTARARSARWACLAGTGLGWALCAKYTAAVPGLGILAWQLGRAWRRPAQAAAGAGWMLAAAGLASAAFLGNDWLFTGNPVYPLFFGGLNWDLANTRVLNDFGCVGYDFSLHSLASLGRAGMRLLADEQPLLLLALPAAGLLRGRLWAPLAVAWLGAAAAWALGVPCLRLMLPVFPALSLASAAAVAPWWDATGRARIPARAAILAMLGLGLTGTLGSTDNNERSFHAALGLESATHYRARRLTTYDEATREVNARLRPAERMLVIGDARGWRFDPVEFNRDVEDTPFMLEFAHNAFSPSGIRRRLRQIGARWVLLNYVTSEYLSPWWSAVRDFQSRELGRVYGFWGSYGEVVWQSPRPDGINGGFVLLRVRDRPGPPPGVLPYLPGAEGVTQRRADETPEAFRARMIRVDRLAPRVSFFAARIGAAELAAGRPAGALAIVMAARSAAYGEADVLEGIAGLALERLGRFQEAAEAFGRAAGLNPGVDEYRLRMRACEALAKR